MNEETFHRVLRDDPGDELTWQALADWLEDDGQAERAELLRLTRRLRTLPRNARGDVAARVESLLAAGVKPVIVERVNSLGMRFALVSPGRFLMGSPQEEAERSEDEKPHEVEITRTFWLGVFAVTQRQWRTVMGNNPSWFCAGGEGAELVKGMDTGDFPVETVSWEDAQEFLEKLNALADKTTNPLTYRLPSEAQWEYACRGGPTSSSKPFHFEHPTDSLSFQQANFNGNYPYGGARNGKPLKRACKVGSYRPNRLGLYDVHGNVWEWCADWYGDYPPGPVVDPLGTPDGSDRVIRGGSWDSGGRNCRAALHFGSTPSYRGSSLGFRVAAVPHE